MFSSRELIVFAAILATGVAASPALAQSKPYRLPSVDLKRQIIWGSERISPDGFGLAFGGQDQQADDGQAHTRILDGVKWEAIHDKLRADNALQPWHDEVWAIRNDLKDFAARVRAMYFEGRHGLRLDNDADHINHIAERMYNSDKSLRKAFYSLPYEQNLAPWKSLRAMSTKLSTPTVSAASAEEFVQLARNCEFVAAALGAEPQPRANSPLVFDPTSKKFVLFGGDHLDYLSNDTWVFHPESKCWEHRRPKLSPGPRANHSWRIRENGELVMSGGYTYTSNTDYMGGQYINVDDTAWTYDVAENKWSCKAIDLGSKLSYDARTYRSGPFDPAWYYTEEEPPNRNQVALRLSRLAANKWVSMNPPRLPRLNRDWGTAILDPDRDLILRYSGGHSAHGGTDVLHYHLATNRWELTMPVEFPLGQLYSNTEYPDGFNFNLRPWITGHSYQSYGYDPLSRKMLFTGRPRHTYFYDPERGDWSGRFTKPDSMSYDSCFYTLTLCTTPNGLYAWTQGGELLRFAPDEPAWQPATLQGEKLPGSVVDNSTLTFDSERNRLLFVRKEYGDKATFDGQIHAVDLASGAVSKLSPKNSEHASKIPYLCQLRYDEANDLVMVGGTLPPDEKGIRRTPAYDCLTNAWISLNIGGIDPSDPKGRNVSLGLVYDPRRNLFWAVDTDSEVYVLRLSVGFADRRPLR